MAISLSYHKLFTIGVDSLMMLKWSHTTDITNMGQFNHHFSQCITININSIQVLTQDDARIATCKNHASLLHA